MGDINYRIIAFDPGGTTGWASYSAFAIDDVNGNGTRTYHNETWAQGQLGPEEHHGQLNALLELQRVKDYTLVSESFEFRNRARDGLELISREYIGVIKLFAEEEEVSLYMQTAAQGKGFITDRKIKAAGLWHPGWKHAMDATRHLLFHMVNKQRRMDLVERWWKPT